MGQKNIDYSFTRVVHVCYFVDDEKFNPSINIVVIDDTVDLNAGFIPAHWIGSCEIPDQPTILIDSSGILN